MSDFLKLPILNSLSRNPARRRELSGEVSERLSEVTAPAARESMGAAC